MSAEMVVALRDDVFPSNAAMAQRDAGGHWLLKVMSAEGWYTIAFARRGEHTVEFPAPATTVSLSLLRRFIEVVEAPVMVSCRQCHRVEHLTQRDMLEWVCKTCGVRNHLSIAQATVATGPGAVTQAFANDLREAGEAQTRYLKWREDNPGKAPPEKL